MDKLSRWWILELYWCTEKELNKAMEWIEWQECTIEINKKSYSVILYDDQAILNVWYKLFWRPIEEVRELTEFDKNMKQAIDFNPNE